MACTNHIETVVHSPGYTVTIKLYCVINVVCFNWVNYLWCCAFVIFAYTQERMSEAVNVVPCSSPIANIPNLMDITVILPVIPYPYHVISFLVYYNFPMWMSFAMRNCVALNGALCVFVAAVRTLSICADVCMLACVCVSFALVQNSFHN